MNGTHARRGDLVWALFNQVVSNRTILEHSFSLEHTRPVSDFDLTKELNKAAYDIIGYAFSKAIFTTIDVIKTTTAPHRPKDIFERLMLEVHYEHFLEKYLFFLQRRKARFLMNYYRILGLTTLIAEHTEEAESYRLQLADESRLKAFERTTTDAFKPETLRPFFKEITHACWSYSKSIIPVAENETYYHQHLQMYFGLEIPLRILGSGAEGIAFTDETWVYKCFYNILDNEWHFLQRISGCFEASDMLECVTYFEQDGFRFIRYPFHPFQQLNSIEIEKLINFLKFCKQQQFVFTNIKPGNFIQTLSGNLKLIDYGKSFEPFDQAKYLNSIKRAFLLWKNPTMDNEAFQSITALLNAGEAPDEIEGWERLGMAVEPRTKEEILDAEIIALVKPFRPAQILDYGSGKCKTARQLQSETDAKIVVFDINSEVLKKRCWGFEKYVPDQSRFNQIFDIVVLNLVLCEVASDVMQNILSDIRIALKSSGKLVVSVCNPDFAHVSQTEFQQRTALPPSNRKEAVLTKTCVYTGNLKTEYHRPTAWYKAMFQQQGFGLLSTCDTSGVNVATLEPASDFKIFVLTCEA